MNFYDAFFNSSMSKKSREAMTCQLSDHLPLWAEFRINETSLDQLIQQ